MLKKILYAIGFHFGHGFRKAFNSELDHIIRNKSFHLESRHEYEKKKKSYQFFENEIEKSFLSKNRLDNLSYALEKIEKINNKNLFLEFGVFHGRTTNFISDILKSYNINLTAFDSFEGLSEDRKGTSDKMGTFENKNFENLKLNENIDLIKGNIYETFPKFLSNIQNKIDFIHIDTDTYEVSKFILENAKSRLNKNSIIVFDDFHNFPGWSQGEHKSLLETFQNNEYEYLSFSYSHQASIRIK